MEQQPGGLLAMADIALGALEDLGVREDVEHADGTFGAVGIVGVVHLSARDKTGLGIGGQGQCDVPDAAMAEVAQQPREFTAGGAVRDQQLGHPRIDGSPRGDHGYAAAREQGHRGVVSWSA